MNKNTDRNVLLIAAVVIILLICCCIVIFAFVFLGGFAGFTSFSGSVVATPVVIPLP